MLLASMPLCFVIPYRIKALPIAFLFLVGVTLLLTSREHRLRFAQARLVILACVLNLLLTAVNVEIFGSSLDSLDLASQNLVFLGIAGVFALPLRWRLIWILFSLTACILGGINVIQHYVHGIDRPYGINNGSWGAIEYAMILIVLSLLALVQMLRTSATPWEKCIHATSFALGLFGALLSQSRGPLLAFIPVFLLVITLHIFRTRHWRGGLFILFAVVVCTSAVVVYIQPDLQARMLEIHTEVDSYNPINDARGSVRERLELWRTAFRAFREHPLLGVGIDRFGDYVRQQVAQGRSNPIIYQYVHAHNEYLEAVATAGLPGLLILLCVFLFPAYVFTLRISNPDETTALAATCGLVVVTVYALCALTDNVFYRAMPHSLYFFLVTGLAVPPLRPYATPPHISAGNHGTHQSNCLG